MHGSRKEEGGTAGRRGDPEEPVRYAVVGLGWMAQDAVLPAFANSSGSTLAALVSGDPEKLRALGDRYGVERRYHYDGYSDLLGSGVVDAVYLALPNHLHLEYTLRACHAGVHVLCEKPMATREEDCRAMIEAAESAGVRLMLAYRLHFDPANLRAAELVRSGAIGEPRYFSSIFSTPVHDPSNIRLRRDVGGGTLFDIGIYCINAARYLFGEEPTEVWCRGRGMGEAPFEEVPATTASVLGFPGDRLAAFTCSFDTAPANAYSLLGAEGRLELDPAYDLNTAYRLEIHGKEDSREEFFPASDQVGPQLSYFSECIVDGREPEPGGREGLADVRVIQALQRSMASGCVEELEPFEVAARPTPEQASEHPLGGTPDLVKTSPPE